MGGEAVNKNREPTRAERMNFMRAARILRNLGQAGLYVFVGSGTLCLMDKSPQEKGAVYESMAMPRIDGGDW